MSLSIWHESLARFLPIMNLHSHSDAGHVGTCEGNERENTVKHVLF